jgi:hypothetical protein
VERKKCMKLSFGFSFLVRKEKPAVRQKQQKQNISGR